MKNEGRSRLGMAQQWHGYLCSRSRWKQWAVEVRHGRLGYLEKIMVSLWSIEWPLDEAGEIA